MWRHFRNAAIILTSMTLVTGIAYPVLVTALAQLTFSHSANGGLIERDGKQVGAELIGQSFTRPEYFWGRLSSTAPVPYNAAASSGSNLGPRNPAWKAKVVARLEALQKADPELKSAPIDLVTASGSGLDPHISPAAADAQIQRVAAARGMSAEKVRELVQAHTAGPTFGVIGEPRVHVLHLNLALDEAARK